MRILACPICKQELAAYKCESCGIPFSGEVVPAFICREMYPSQAAYAEAMRVIDFWGQGWRKRLEEPDHKFLYALDEHGLTEHADRYATWCRENGSLMADVPLLEMDGATALNIGCGAGDEAVLLARNGATCIAMDITAPAAEATHSLLQKLRRGIGIQGDSRFLPLQTATVDLVYSSGVLHHSSDLPKSVSEIHRVLKPGGTAYVMLYATWSIVFLQEKLLGRTGEQAWETEGRTNPCTTTHAAAECRKLFAEFERVDVRKRGGKLGQVMGIGRFMPSVFDRWLDGPLGPTLNIVARKKPPT